MKDVIGYVLIWVLAISLIEFITSLDPTSKSPTARCVRWLWSLVT